MLDQLGLSEEEISKLAEDLCKVGKSLAAKNMVHYLLGTISARISKNPPRFLVKPAHCLYEIAEPSDFVSVDENGTPTDGSGRRPSLNFLAHVACYNARPDIDAVVHAHPENIVALISMRGLRLNQSPPEVSLLTQEAVWMVKRHAITIVEDLYPKELAVAVAKEVVNGNVVAIRNHGIIAVGKTIWEAYGTALVAEAEASMLIKILSMNALPLSRDTKTALEDLRFMPPTFSPKFLG